MTVNRAFYISRKKISQAGEFIMEYGRDIDQIIFKHYFRKEPASSVVSTLEGYINEDGGAGGLEPDMDYEGSTPISCSIFFTILHEIKIAAEFDAVTSVLDYLLKNLNAKKSWIPMVPMVENMPRARWWNWDEEKNNIFSFNPTCELIGYFYHFGGGNYRAFSKDMLELLHQELVKKFVGTLEMHDVISLMQLCRVLPDTVSERFVNILRSHLKEMLVTDRNSWGNGYVMSPLTVFKSPFDPLYYDFEKEINSNLDYEINAQTESGVWTPNWTWGQFEEEFENKEKQITAYVTMNKLIQFRNFDRITRIR